MHVSQEIHNQREKYKDFIHEINTLKNARGDEFLFIGLSFASVEESALMRSSLTKS